MYPHSYQWRHPAHRVAEVQADRSGTYAEGVRRVPGPHTMRPRVSQDQGPNPYVLDIEKAAERNNNFRVAIWTGSHLQVTLMSIPVGQDIGVEMHPHVDQFLRIEDGDGLVQMGRSRDQLDFRRRVEDGSAIMIPAGTWHNVTNIGDEPLKLYSIYAPPQHPHGTAHWTKAEAMVAER